MALKVVQHATCTFCGCVCDDIELHADGERIVKAKNACSLGDAWFKHHTAERAFPDALIDGRPASMDDAIEAAAAYLYDANMPLVYGLSNITCEAQREAVALGRAAPPSADRHLRSANRSPGAPTARPGSVTSPGSGRARCAGRSSKPPNTPSVAVDRCARASSGSQSAAGAKSQK